MDYRFCGKEVKRNAKNKQSKNNKERPTIKSQEKFQKKGEKSYTKN